MDEHMATEIAYKNGYKKAAEEIFADIQEDCFDQFGYFDYDAFDELKKKYIKGERQ